jgi:general secretion pathway protein C
MDFQKYKWVFTVGTLLTSSFLTARAATYYADSAILEKIPEQPAKPTAARPLAKKIPALQHKSGAEITGRNIFDSQAHAVSETPASAPTAEVISDAPADCTNATQDPSGATLKGTIVAAPEEYSNITLSENGSKGTSIYWFGEKAFNGEAEVYKVHAKKVFFKRPSGCTYLTLGEVGVAKPVAPAAPVPPPALGGEPAITTEGITKTGENSYEISRDLINSKLSDLSSLMTEAKALPNMKNGEFNGFKLYAMRSTSLFGQIGLKNGDIIQSVNGEKVDSLEKAMQLLETFKNASSVQLGLQRRGAQTNMDYTIR